MGCNSENNRSFSGPTSELPNPLLLQILSSLDLKDAVRTGFLSKRWKNLWTQIDKITFIYRQDLVGLDYEKKRDFNCSVDRTLMRCACPRIKSFSLRLVSNPNDYNDCHAYFFLKKWRKYVFSKKLEHLVLELRNYKDFHYVLFDGGSSLVNLELQGNGFCGPIQGNPPMNCRWNSLRNLSVMDVDWSNDGLKEMLSHCPFLESLSLGGFTSITKLNLTSPKLRKLQVFDMSSPSLYVDAPWLQELEISGGFEGHILCLNNMPKLKIAKITCEFSHDISRQYYMYNKASKLLENFQHVEELTLGQFFFWPLASFPWEDKPSFKYFKCKHLTLHSPIGETEFPGIAHFLCHLETLIMHITAYNEPSLSGMWYFPKYMNGIEYLSSGDRILSQLKKVIITLWMFVFSEGIQEQPDVSSNSIRSASAKECTCSREDDSLTAFNQLLQLANRMSFAGEYREKNFQRLSVEIAEEMLSVLGIKSILGDGSKNWLS